MIPPLVVFSRSGVDVVRDESAYPPILKARLKERRRRSPLWWTTNGVAAGMCVGYLVNLAASEASTEWTSPSTLMAVGTLIFAAGQLWSARLDDRRRITKLEERTATKESVELLADTVKRIEDKLDRMIERQH